MYCEWMNLFIMKYYDQTRAADLPSNTIFSTILEKNPNTWFKKKNRNNL